MMATYYVVQAFQTGKRGVLIADQPREAKGVDHALALAERLAESRAGVIAFSRAGDPDTGDYDDAEILARHGVVPEALLEAVA